MSIYSKGVIYSLIITIYCGFFIDSAVAQNLYFSDSGAGSSLSDPELNRQSYISKATGQQRKYFVYLPKGYFDLPHLDWPVLFFLHGSGERGDGDKDLDRVLSYGPLYEAWIQKRSLPFIIIAPQLPVFGMTEQIAGWKYKSPPKRLKQGTPPRYLICPLPGDNATAIDSSDCEIQPHRRAFNKVQGKALPIARKSADKHLRIKPFNMEFTYPPEEWPPNGWYRVEEDLMKILDQVHDNFRTDSNRVYLTGVSYGGFGTFDLAASHPDIWAAIAPIVGTGDLSDASVLAKNNIPIWMFGSGVDPLVKPHWLYRMARELEEEGHPNVRFTVHEDMSHDAWLRVYEGWDLYYWLLDKRLSDRE